MKTLLLLLFTFLVVEGLNTGDHKDQAKKLTELLESQGYTVQYGTYEYMTPDRCQEMDTCYANNPSSPYGIIFLPKGPQEDVSTYSNWGKILMTQVDGVNMSSNYRLDTNETIVMLDKHPQDPCTSAMLRTSLTVGILTIGRQAVVPKLVNVPM